MRNYIREILRRGQSENCSADDEKEMNALFHQPEYEKDIKEKLLDDLYSDSLELGDLSNAPNKELLFSQTWAEIRKSQHKKNSNKRFIRNIFKISAAVLFGLFLGNYINLNKTTPEPPVYYEARAPKGSIMELILPDKSIIYLNADSKIRYSTNDNYEIREVFLNGEAWFDITKNEHKPFLVHTSFYTINVTGTKFNVKNYPTDNKVVTTLEEGEIILKSTENFKLEKSITLTPGEQATLLKNSKELNIREVNPKWYTSWKDNKLIFVNMHLKELEVLLERKYGVEIEIKNKEILDLHFDGTIKNESIMEFLEIIKNTLPITYKIVGQKIEITNSN